MAYKTILVHCDAGAKVAQRLAVAAGLAERHGAHLIGAYARPPFDAPALFDGTMPTGALYDAHERAADADQAAAAAAFAKAIKGRHVAHEWRVVEGYADEQLVIQARYADLMVLGQSDPEASSATPPALPESVVLATGRPALVVPHIGAAAKPAETVMLCWNASRESARAASDALPMLLQAKKVIVLLVDARSTASGHGAEPGADVGTWLARHGVEVTVQRDVAANADVGGVILSRAADHDVELIVMGLYGHSRLFELVLGGASRSLLASMTVPVLVAH